MKNASQSEIRTKEIEPSKNKAGALPQAESGAASLGSAYSGSAPSASPHTKNLALDAAPGLALPWVVRLRYGMVVCGVVLLSIALHAFHLHRAIFLWALTPFALILITNLWLYRAQRHSPHTNQETLGSIFVFDTLCLTVVLSLTGGPMNPFSLLFLVQITLSVVVLKKEWTWVLGALSAACFGALFFVNVPLMGMRLMPAERELYPHLVGMWISFVIAAALISFFAASVSDALRLRGQQVLALQEQVARQDRLASLGTLAAGAAHELGTPLGTIAIVARDLEKFAERLAIESSVEELCEDARLIRSEVARCQRILNGMSADGAEAVGEARRTLPLHEFLEQTLAQFPDAARNRILLDPVDSKQQISLPVRATMQSLTALLQNGLDASKNPTPICLKAICHNGKVEFSVVDKGSGMSEEILRRITEPFFTTKEPGKGMGLGSFLVRTYAERLGGQLTYTSAPGQGTTATMTLPATMATKTGISHHDRR